MLDQGWEKVVERIDAWLQRLPGLRNGLQGFTP
jgi:hypothetical protein